MDFKVEIGLCTEYQLSRMFSRFYPQEGVVEHPLASSFAATLGDSLVSAAQVQGFLLVYKSSPQSAMAALPEFKEQCLRQRDKL